MYSKFYGLSHKPFELSPDPDLVFLSETHQEALAVLLYGVYNRKGFLQISGKVGTGKSTLVQSLIRKLENNVLVCHIPNPNFTIAEFYYYIGAKFGLEPFDGNRAKFILDLAEFLKQCREKGEFALLIIDEAQVLSLELLEEIRLLSNQEYTEFGVLSIFFVGQPELNVLLKHKKMEPLRNRIGIRFNLEPLTLDETVAYIQFRLRKAGRTAPLFSPKAMQKIHEASGGIPRSINILCDNGLLTGFAEQRGVIDENIIIGCVREIEQPDLVASGPDSAQIGSSILPEPGPESTRPVIQQANLEADKAGTERKPNAVLKNLAFVGVILCALFIAMTYTTEYWGQLPGTAPAKAWFEKIHENTPVIRKLKELFVTQKRGAQLNKSDNNNVSGEVVALPVKQEDKVNVSNNSADAAKPIAEQAEVVSPANSEVIIKKKQDPGGIVGAVAQVETGHDPEKVNQSPTQQAGTEQKVTSPGESVAASEQLEIKRNPDGTNYISITRQVAPGQGRGSLPNAEAIAEPVKTAQKADESKYVSIIDQVGGANIRTGPSMDDAIMRAVIPGYPFRVIGRYDDWSLVEDFKGRNGWVASILIDENNTVILKTDTVNLRSGPGYQNDVVASMNYGTVLQVNEKRGAWLKVNIGEGVVGWIPKDKAWP